MKLRISRLILCAVSLGLAVAAAWGAATQRAPWPGKAFTEVRAYFYNLEDQSHAKVMTNGHLSRSVVNTNGALLSQDQIQRLLGSLQRPAPEKTFFTNCYVPHHAFAFYNAARQPVAWIELCFYCGGSDAFPPSVGLKGQFDQRPAAEIMREPALPVSADDYMKARAQRRAERRKL